ncbi:MAG: type I-C CRISPR-associated protein Cas8c/Csd1 [Verrucomicrobiales bacterium]
MLNSLCKLAEREHLVGDPAFEMKPVGWIISLDEKGKFCGFLPTHQSSPAKEGTKRKSKPVAKQFLVPRHFNPTTGGARTSGDFAYFLVDKLDYVLGVSEGADRGTKPEGKPLNRITLFRDKADACRAATGDEALDAVVAFLDAVISGGLPDDLPGNLKAGELFAFRVAPSTSSLVHDIAEVRTWWLDHIGAAAENEGTGALQCLITGLPVTKTGLFPKIKRVPGGQQAGAGLVSFNATAFESYGFDKGENAPISTDAAQKAATALNRLLDSAFKTQDGKTLPRRNLRVTSKLVLCYWSADGSFEDDFADIIEVEDDAGKVGDLAESIWTGKLGDDIDEPTEFYAVILSGAQGRVIVRDYFRTTVGAMKEALRWHFETLAIEPVTRPPKGKQLPPIAGYTKLLQSVILGGSKDDVPDPLAADFLRTILAGKGSGIPLPLVTRAIARDRAEIHDDSWSASLRRDRRTAILKAFLIRNHNLEFAPAMEPANHNPPYLLGRLFAALGEMQRLAHHPRKINATITDKFYGQAAAGPMFAFGKLNDLYERHRRKALENRSAEWVAPKANIIARTIGKIFASLHESDLPEAFDLRGQAAFALGFQHQSHFQSLGKEEQLAFCKRNDIDPEKPENLIYINTKEGEKK